MERHGIADIVGGLGLVAIGSFAAFHSTRYSIGTLQHVGSGFFPLALAIILLSLGAAITVIGFVQRQSVGEIQYFNLISVIASIVVFYFSVERLGLIVSIIITACICSLPTTMTWRGRIALGTGLSIACYSVFILGLGMTIPVWPRIF